MKNCPHHHDEKHDSHESGMTERDKSRRDFLRTMGVAAAGMVLAGCQAPTAAPTSTSVPTVPPTTPPTTAPTITSVTGVPGASQPVVAITKAVTYERSLVKQQVQTLLDSLGGLSDVLQHGNRVAMKVNLTGGISSGSLPGIPETESFLTHPEVVRALGELLRDAGVTKLYIVEAEYEAQSYPYYGYTDAAKTIDATLVDLTYAEPYKDFDAAPVGAKAFYYDKFTFNHILADIDAFISVSKMKCHNIAGVTHTMKNLFGLVPYRFYTLNSGDKYRSGFHGVSNSTQERLPRVIMDLNRARPVNFSLIDGIMTIEGGEGPWIKGVAQLKPGVLFAGKNPVATDAVATAAMGFDPTTDYPNPPFMYADNHLNIARELGLGTNHLDEIKVVGPAITDVRMQFKPSYQ